MTAALAVGLARKMGTEEILQLNVTRRALGTGTGTQVEQLAKLADLHEAP